MSDNGGEATSEQDQQDDAQDTTGEQQGEDTGTDLAAELEKVKAHSRTWEQRSKANADKARQWDEYQESRQKQADQQQALATERDDARRESALLRLAVKNNLDEDAVNEITELLEGVPADQYAARAERLASRLAPKQQARTPDRSLGRETKGSTGTGDWLRDQFNNRR